MTVFGVVGKKISYSLSPKIYKKLATLSNVEIDYRIFDVEDIESFTKILKECKGLAGFNVTIPFKTSIIDIIDYVSPEVAKIGATNCVVIDDNKKLHAFNTDWLAFKNTLITIKEDFHNKALVLGSGGAAAAVVFALESLNVDYLIVSRNKIETHNKLFDANKIISYNDLETVCFDEYNIVVNATPCGTEKNKCQQIEMFPFDMIKDNSLFYDLVYNPPVTPFLQEGINRNCLVINGQSMLEQQAEIAWSKYFLPLVK